MKNIVLIGMPGCGKSTIGKILSEELNMEYCDVDEYIEVITKKTIPEIFQDGEESFRRIESDAIIEISKEENTIIATGGGAIKSLDNIESLRKNGIIVFINRPLDSIMADIDIINRPLIKRSKEKLNTLFKERYPLYKKYCDGEVMNIGDLHKVVQKIIELVR